MSQSKKQSYNRATAGQTADRGDKPKREIESYRRCPICWERSGGYGLAYSTHGPTRYYKCSAAADGQQPCGHTWTVTVKVEVLRAEHRPVILDGERKTD